MAYQLSKENLINIPKNLHLVHRQMKKDEEFFLQRLSCGISRLKRKNQIVRVRGPLNQPDEIPCNSHERDYEDSLPENPFSIDIVPKGEYWNICTFELIYSYNF